MIKNESDILDYIQAKINTKSPNVVKSIGDDCAVIRISNKQSFVITTDTSLEGPHFTKDYTAFEIGYKSLSTNLSDIAAMGCIPKYIFMSLTLPKLDTNWIKSFYKGIDTHVEKFNLALIGGDTNRGPLSISIQVIGINKSKILYRDGANFDDDIYVSGKLGLARAALILKNKKKFIKEFNMLKKYLHMPIPRIDAGLKLSKFANSCIDISDGLMKDLSSIINQSNCGAEIYLERIPTHRLLKKLIPKSKYYECLIGGGEDYELCFTVSKSQRKNMQLIAKNLKLPLTIIGKITKKNILFKENGVEKKLNIKGFDHFS
jgi:thiamine-monophosphate kinase